MRHHWKSYAILRLHMAQMGLGWSTIPLNQLKRRGDLTPRVWVCQVCMNVMPHRSAHPIPQRCTRCLNVV